MLRGFQTENTMKTRWHRTAITAAILCSIVATGIRMTVAKVRVDDLPKPIPRVMDKVKEVGNEVGKGLSKTASTTADAVNKAVKGEKSENQTSQKTAK
jgi:hypothetical protein